MHKKHILSTVLLLMLVSAIVHMLILFVLAVIKRDLSYINYFSIMEIDNLIPGSAAGFTHFMASVVLVFVLFFILYGLNMKYGKKVATWLFEK